MSVKPTNPAPAYNSGLPWLEEEDEFILAWRGTTPDLCAALGRTKNSVEVRRAALRKHGCPNQYRRCAQESTQDFAVNAGKPWRPEEDTLVLAQSVPDIDLAFQLGRTLYSVSDRRVKLRQL